jgi:hypothetical protein
MQQFFEENVISKYIWSPTIVNDIFNTMEKSIELNLEDSIDKEEILVKKNVNILILGSGEVGKYHSINITGKSTIYKQISSQFNKNHDNDYSRYFPITVSNVVWSLGKILIILKKSDWHLKYDKEEQKFIDEIIDRVSRTDHELDPLKISIFLKKLLKDDEFNHIIENHHQHFLNDCILHQLPNFENFLNLGVVTKQDYLQ